MFCATLIGIIWGQILGMGETDLCLCKSEIIFREQPSFFNCMLEINISYSHQGWDHVLALQDFSDSSHLSCVPSGFPNAWFGFGNMNEIHKCLATTGVPAMCFRPAAVLGNWLHHLKPHSSSLGGSEEGLPTTGYTIQNQSPQLGGSEGFRSLHI